MYGGTLDTILSPPLNRGLAADIALRLRTAILHGYFAPGEHLREEAIAKSLGVSRGPVREAFSQLEREGMVVIQRNRGTFVARLTREDAEEVYSLRRVLERLAAEYAARCATAAQLDAMQRVIDTMAHYTERGITEQEAAELDVQFHQLLYQASGHKRLYDCWTNLQRQIHILLLSRNVADADYRVVTVSSHQIILDALRDRDATRAATLIDDHLRGSYERVIGAMDTIDGDRDDAPPGNAPAPNGTQKG
jgi:DNA-binding GntR family transcriptional regulator